jgi:hypothetical protein
MYGLVCYTRLGLIQALSANIKIDSDITLAFFAKIKRISKTFG